MSSVIFAGLIGIMLSSCGPSDYDEYRSEKEKRVITQNQLEISQHAAGIYKAALSGVKTTQNYLWIPLVDPDSNPNENDRYDVSKKTCQSFGFELPTADMVAEAETNPGLRQMMYSESGARVFVAADQEIPAIVLLTLCAKKI